MRAALLAVSAAIEDWSSTLKVFSQPANRHGNPPLRIVLALAAAAIIVGAVVFSKRKSIAVAEEKEEAGVRQI